MISIQDASSTTTAKRLVTTVGTITLKQRGSSDGEGVDNADAALDDGSDNNKVPSKPPAWGWRTTPFGRSQASPAMPSTDLSNSPLHVDA